jgi:predicted NUDIX family phosphoesterase
MRMRAHCGAQALVVCRGGPRRSKTLPPEITRKVVILKTRKRARPGAHIGFDWLMALFLKAAYKVLEAKNQALSAREITDLARDAGLLQTSGRTPWQTMKSKLSTDILRRADQSLFMRTAQGQFGLRAWKTRLDEHVAERYQKALFDEDIVVIPASSLLRYVPGPGLYKGDFDRFSLLEECRPMRRRDAEDDETVIQLVSVFIVRYENKYLTYKRTKRLPESRLHGFYSIAFGGHLNPDDLKPLFNVFEADSPFLTRELREELRVKDTDISGMTYRGLLYDDSRPVSKQHLGVAYDVWLNTVHYEIGERGFLMDSKFETLHEIANRLDQFENWSVLLAAQEQLCWP